MNLNTSVLIVGFVVSAITGLGLVYPKTDLSAVAANVKAQLEENLGAVSGPDRFNQCESTNGIVRCFHRVAFRQATSTPFAVQGPAATSTIVSYACKINVASSSATIWHAARAATPYATTTLLGTAHTVAAGTQDIIVASTSPAVGDAVVLSPNNYVVLGVQGGVVGSDTVGAGFVPNGNCSVTFEVI